MSAREPGPLAALHGVGKRFGGVQALDGIHLEVSTGEVVGVVGDNGAGKSTLLNIMGGSISPDRGEMRIGGRVVRLQSPSDALHLGIASVYQDLALCDNLDTVANLFLGRERMRSIVPGVIQALDELAMERLTLDLMNRVGISIADLRAPVAVLSGGQRQAVAIARALLGQPRLVLLDEPTASLGVVQARHVLKIVLRMRAEGLGVVMVSHNLADVFEVASRIVVLRLGKCAGTFQPSTENLERVVAAMTGASTALPVIEGER